MIDLGLKDNWWGIMMGYNSFYKLSVLCYIVLHIRYCNISWSVRGGYVRYAVWRPITNTHENMSNIMSTGCGSA